MKALAPATDANDKEKKRFPRLTTRASVAIDLYVNDRDQLVQWPIPIRQAMEGLTVKQRHFAVCVASGKSIVEAYRTAYDVSEDATFSTVSGSAYEAKNNPRVSTLIDLLVDWLSREWLLDANEVIQYGYSRLYEEAEHAANASDRIRATEALMKAHGAFVSRSEVKHIHEVAAPVQELMSSFLDLIGMAVPISPQPRQIAAVDSIEFIDPEPTDQ